MQLCAVLLCTREKSQLVELLCSVCFIATFGHTQVSNLEHYLVRFWFLTIDNHIRSMLYLFEPYDTCHSASVRVLIFLLYTSINLATTI